MLPSDPKPASDKSRSSGRIGIGSVAALALLLLEATTISFHAQTASQITPPTFRPSETRLGTGSVKINGNAGLDAPPGADRLSVRVAKVSVDGAFPSMDAANRRFERRLSGRSVPVSEIFAAARNLESDYAAGLPPEKWSSLK